MFKKSQKKTLWAEMSYIYIYIYEDASLAAVSMGRDAVNSSPFWNGMCTIELYSLPIRPMIRLLQTRRRVCNLRTHIYAVKL